jgi:hypothetical protein
VATEAGTLLLRNCLLANSPSGGNASGSIADAGHNLSSDASGAFKAAGSLNEVDPKLGELGDNGGYTPTVPLLRASPAIDAGEDLSEIATDQREVARPLGAHTDIGAYEFEPVVMGGRIMRRNSVPFAGITVTLYSVTTDTLTTVSGADGWFGFTNLDAVTYLLSPPTGGVGFEPTNYVFTVESAGQSQTNFNFLANPERILNDFAPANQARHITAIGLPGQHYRFEASTNLTTWEVIATQTADADGKLECTDTGAQTIPRRFYRTVGQ